jgi:hypothetical protein
MDTIAEFFRSVWHAANYPIPTEWFILIGMVAAALGYLFAKHHR